MTERGPPIDKGWAWMCLLGSFVVNMVIVGGFKSLGIFLVEFLEIFHASTSVTALFLGTTGLGISLLAPVANAIGERFSYRLVVIFGGMLLAVAAIATAFTPNLAYLILVFGLFSGIGYGLAYSPAIVVVGQYFHEKRSLATGIAIAGASVGQLALPPLMRWAVDKYTVRGAMFIFAGYNLHVVLCGALYRPFSFYTRGRFKGMDEKCKSDDSGVEDVLEHEIDSSAMPDDTSGKKFATPEDLPHCMSNRDKYESEDANKGTKSTSQSKVTFQTDNMDNVQFAEESNDLAKNVDAEYLPLQTQGTNSSLPKSQSKTSIASDISEMSGKFTTLMNSTGSICIVPKKVRKKSKVTIVVPMKPMDDLQQIEGHTSKTDCCSCMNSCKQQGKQDKQPLYEFSLFCNPLFLIYILSVVLGNAGFINPVLFVPAYAIDLGATKERSSLLVSLMGATDFFGRILSGWFGNLGIFERYRILASCQFLTGLVLVASQIVPSYPSLIVMSISQGLIGGSALAMISVVLVDFMGLEKLSSGHGLCMMCIGLSQMPMPTLVGLMRDMTGSYRVPFIVSGILMIVASLLLSLKPLVSRWQERKAERKLLDS